MREARKRMKEKFDTKEKSDVAEFVKKEKCFLRDIHLLRPLNEHGVRWLCYITAV